MVDDNYNNTYEIVTNCFHCHACIIHTVEKKSCQMYEITFITAMGGVQKGLVIAYQKRCCIVGFVLQAS